MTITDPAAPVGADVAALPVALDLAGPHADGVRRWVEGVLGWQPVEGEMADLVPPALRVFDLGAPTGPASARPLPSVLLLDESDPVAEVAMVAGRDRPDLALTWPRDRERLSEMVDGLLARPRRQVATGRVLRVGGAAGGTGASTVALALAGLAGWSGLRALAAVGPTAPVGEVVSVEAAALEAPDLWRRATPLPGVPRARAVRVVDRQPFPEPSSTDLEVVVLDVGVASDVDVLVCRADAAGLDAAAATTAAAIVVTGEGPASSAAVRRACGARHWLALPRSARVERAGLQRRVPGALPGSFLRALRPLAPTAAARPRPG